MNYATQHHIGNYQHTRTETTTAIAPTVGRVRQLATKTKGRKPSAERQAEIRTNSNATNGILKCTFLPKLKTAKSVQACQKTERDFYKSLSQLAEHCSIEPMQTHSFKFPYNVVLAMWDMEVKAKRTNINWDGFKLIQDSTKTYFTSEERYNTGAILYYIPIVPLYRLSKNPKRKQAVQLLQSVCSYLYHIARIPYYRKQDSYLFWMYEMVTEWITSDDENEETPIYLAEIKQAEQIGDFMEQKIYNQNNLTRFKDHLKSFKAKDSFDNDCFMLARKIFSLYQQYPNATIYQNLQSNTETEEYESDTVISMDKYVSFCSEAKGLLFQTLFEAVNSDLQEYATMQEPRVIKKFDGRNITNNNLDFENRLFPLIEELIYILNNF